MARKQDPIFSVMDFFEKEPLPVVQSTFSLVKRIVVKRQLAEQPPVEKKPKRRRTTVSTPAPANTATPIAPFGDVALLLPDPAPATGPTLAPPPAAESTTVTRPVPPRRRADAAAGTAAATTTPPTQPATPPVALPGLGPSTIGE